jgi:hypothetical protein
LVGFFSLLLNTTPIASPSFSKYHSTIHSWGRWVGSRLWSSSSYTGNRKEALYLHNCQCAVAINTWYYLMGSILSFHRSEMGSTWHLSLHYYVPGSFFT